MPVGMVRSVMTLRATRVSPVLAGVGVAGAGHTTLCMRARRLGVSFAGPLHLGLFGEGEWKVRQHGYTKRRDCVHLSVDSETQEIQAVWCCVRPAFSTPVGGADEW